MSSSSFRLRVENYRCLRHIDWSPGGVCALVGANGSGKTTLLSVLRLMRDYYDKGAQAALGFHGGAHGFKNLLARDEEPVSFGVTVGDTTWTLRMNPATPAETVLEEGLLEGETDVVTYDGQAGTFLLGKDETRLLSGRGVLRSIVESTPDRRKHFSALVGLVLDYEHYQNPHLWTLRKQGSEMRTETRLYATGQDAFSVVRNWLAGSREHRERWEFVHRTLKAAFPESYDDFDTETAGQTVAGRFYIPGVRQPVQAFSTATGVLLGLMHLCAIASAPDHSVVAIDEMENGLHPFAIRRLIEALRERAEEKGLTILLATHSPVVLNAFSDEPSKVYVLEHSRRDQPQPIALDKLKDPSWLSHFVLGDLYGRDFGIQGPPPPADPSEREP